MLNSTMDEINNSTGRKIISYIDGNVGVSLDTEMNIMHSELTKLINEFLESNRSVFECEDDTKLFIDCLNEVIVSK